ncbi:MAG: hypothetical protein K6E18_03340 [Lachnospiraceae bacterium]|nr:hypothetical protein [Lachnospiraceae bacterium]
MKTIYLHIGQPKTGTSSIQLFCAKNRDFLKQNGVSYDYMPYEYRGTRRERNARFLTCDLRDEKGNVIPRGREERIPEALELVKKQLEESDSVFLTDERLWNHFFDFGYETLQMVKKFADANAFRLCILVYLRPQDQWLMSLYHQRIQMGYREQSFEAMLESKDPKWQADYWRALEDLSGIVGQENMIVRLYDRSLFPGGRIEEDFLEAIGLGNKEGYEIPERETNPSLSGSYAEIMRVLNNYATQQEPPVVERLFEETAAGCSQRFGSLDPGSLLSEKALGILRKLYEEGNHKVEEKYLKKGTLSLKSTPSEPIWSADSADMRQAQLLYMGQLILSQKKEIEQMKKELKAQKAAHEKLCRELKLSRRLGRLFSGKDPAT